MSDGRDPHRRLVGQLKDARRELEQLRRLNGEMRATIIAGFLRDRLLHIDDFDRFVGAENVIDLNGRIDFRELELRVADLLRRRPELAVSSADVGGLAVES